MLGRNSALHMASSNCQHSIIRLLLRRGCDANSANRQGDTPLHIAASPEVVNVLVNKGDANPFLKNKAQLTPVENQTLLAKERKAVFHNPTLVALERAQEMHHRRAFAKQRGEFRAARIVNYDFEYSNTIYPLQRNVLFMRMHSGA